MKEENKKILQSNCHFYNRYTDAERACYEQILLNFLSKTKFIGRDIDVTDEMRFTIGGWAVRMLTHLKLGSYCFSHVKVVNIFPGYFVKPEIAGLMDNGIFYCHISLAWDEVRTSIHNPCRRSNTVLHEFAHALDQMDRILNGVPTMLLEKDKVEGWKAVFNKEYLLNTLHGKVVYYYFGLFRWGAYHNSDVSVPEMFAVATEKYFEDAATFKLIAPEIYELLDSLYKQDKLVRRKNEWSTYASKIFNKSINWLRELK